MSILGQLEDAALSLGKKVALYHQIASENSRAFIDLAALLNISDARLVTPSGLADAIKAMRQEIDKLKVELRIAQEVAVANKAAADREIARCHDHILLLNKQNTRRARKRR